MFIVSAPSKTETPNQLQPSSDLVIKMPKEDENAYAFTKLKGSENYKE